MKFWAVKIDGGFLMRLRADPTVRLFRTRADAAPVAKRNKGKVVRVEVVEV